MRTKSILNVLSIVLHKVYIGFCWYKHTYFLYKFNFERCSMKHSNKSFLKYAGNECKRDVNNLMLIKNNPSIRNTYFINLMKYKVNPN